MPFPADVDHRFTLNVVTASGVNVSLGLASRGDELLVQTNVDAALGDDERKAVADLATGYQEAIDGMTKDVPQLWLGGLSGLDAGLLQSIALHAAVSMPTVPPTPQTLDFHIDAAQRSATQRSVSAETPEGKLDLTVQTDMPDALGSRREQAKAIDSNLKQFDQAAIRGHGDKHLTAMFKDAFSDLSRTSGRGNRKARSGANLKEAANKRPSGANSRSRP